VGALCFTLPLALVWSFDVLSAYYVCRSQPYRQRRWPVTLSLFGGASLLSGLVFLGAGEALNYIGGDIVRGQAFVTMPSAAWVMYFLGGFALYLLSLLAHDVLIAFETVQDAARREAESRVLARDAELQMLRTQINPHFLFNSLNNIYSLMYQNAAGAQEAILGLSDLLRYMLYDASEKVPLQKEVDYINRYIALQRIRFEHPIHVVLHATGPVQTVQVPPLLLIPFVENAFKHGDFSGSLHGVDITVHAGSKSLYFHCTNKKGVGQKDSTGGIGLQNVKRRLDLLYANKYLLKIEDEKYHFTINLELTHE